MKHSALLLPVLMMVAGAVHAQDTGGCPQLPVDADLVWEQRGSATAYVCRALRADGSEAFGMYISHASPFEPKRINRAEAGVIDGRNIHWYRAEIAAQPDVTALETLVKLDNGRVVHLWLQSKSEEQLAAVLRATRELRFSPERRNTQIAGGQ